MPAAATMNPTTDDFAALFEESFAGSNMIEGRVVAATVEGRPAWVELDKTLGAARVLGWLD